MLDYLNFSLISIIKRILFAVDYATFHIISMAPTFTDHCRS